MTGKIANGNKQQSPGTPRLIDRRPVPTPPVHGITRMQLKIRRRIVGKHAVNTVLRQYRTMSPHQNQTSQDGPELPYSEIRQEVPVLPYPLEYGNAGNEA